MKNGTGSCATESPWKREDAERSTASRRGNSFQPRKRVVRLRRVAQQETRNDKKPCRCAWHANLCRRFVWGGWCATGVLPKRLLIRSCVGLSTTGSLAKKHYLLPIRVGDSPSLALVNTREWMWRQRTLAGFSSRQRGPSCWLSDSQNMELAPGISVDCIVVGLAVTTSKHSSRVAPVKAASTDCMLLMIPHHSQKGRFNPQRGNNYCV